MTTIKRSGAVAEAKEPVYSKQQLIASRVYHYHADILTALLKDDHQYTVTEVKALVHNFMTREV